MQRNRELAEEWFFDNITVNHVMAQEGGNPEIVSDLTAYVTPWHGMNLAGRDRNPWSAENVTSLLDS